jgi:RNA polymerase sigma-70 factor (ECF subfamily)
MEEERVTALLTLNATAAAWPLPGPVGELEDGDGAEERRLVAAAQAGDAAAFGRLYARRARAVYVFLARRLGDPEEAEDLRQTVFLRALEALPAYRQTGAPFGIWLFRIARNRHCHVEPHRPDF